jgi:molecular chaperone GrpE (heat shock protein)
MSEPLESPGETTNPTGGAGERHPASLLDPERRRVFLESVAAWLDELRDAEPPPPGLGPEAMSSSVQAPDLFSLLAQLAALTRETQLQGRATNRLHAELGAALERVAESVSSPDAIAKKLVEARREARLELVAELLEVRDRFTRGLEEARRRLASLRGLRARFGQRPVLEALVAGNGLALERLDDALRRFDVHEIPSLGKSFDPRMMRAVEVAATSAAPSGTVLEVFRAGYTADGRVLRFAEVKVAGSQHAAEGESHG